MFCDPIHIVIYVVSMRVIVNSPGVIPSSPRRFSPVVIGNQESIDGVKTRLSLQNPIRFIVIKETCFYRKGLSVLKFAVKEIFYKLIERFYFIGI